MNSGDIGFMLICSALVLLMTPGLAFFYGGLVRRKNVVNTMMTSVFVIGIAAIMWALFGYSLAFGNDHFGIIGDFIWLGLQGIEGSTTDYVSTIPHLEFSIFQMMFAIITPALITGAVAGRMKFKALFLFIILWSVIVYYPMAHMVWGLGGFLAKIGSVDFAGGNVVHISSGAVSYTHLTIVEKLEHRAGKDASGEVGDGVGILLQISHRFFNKVAHNLHITLPQPYDYAVGMFFLPQDTLTRQKAMKTLERIVMKHQATFLGWREVPCHEDILGQKAKDCICLLYTSRCV